MLFLLYCESNFSKVLKPALAGGFSGCFLFLFFSVLLWWVSMSMPLHTQGNCALSCSQWHQKDGGGQKGGDQLVPLPVGRRGALPEAAAAGLGGER